MAEDRTNATELFVLEWTDALIELSRFEQGARARVLAFLDLLAEDLAAAIAAMDLEAIPNAASRRTRAEALARDVRHTIDKRYAQAEGRIVTELNSFGVLARDTAMVVINKVFTVNISTAQITKEQIKLLSKDVLTLGSTVDEWLKSYSTRVKASLLRELRLGAISGETNADIIARIRGKKTGRTKVIQLANGQTKVVPVYNGGILQASRRELDMLVRTSMNSINNQIMQAQYEGLQDVIKGYEAITTLDGRTSDICVARTGAAWNVETGEPLPESSTKEQFPGFPPWHMYCRTVLAPVTYTWEEMVARATGQHAKILDTVPDDVRASFDGLMGKVTSFDQVLTAKGDAWARKKLGPGRFDLWKSGKITTRQLIDQSGRPRTLEQIRAAIGLGT